MNLQIGRKIKRSFQLSAMFVGLTCSAIATSCAVLALGWRPELLLILVLGTCVGAFYASSVGAIPLHEGAERPMRQAPGNIFSWISTLWIWIELLPTHLRSKIAFAITAAAWIPFFRYQHVNAASVFVALLIPVIVVSLAFGPRLGAISAAQATLAFYYIAVTPQFSLALHSYLDLGRIILFLIACVSFILMCVLEMTMEITYLTQVARARQSGSRRR